MSGNLSLYSIPAYWILALVPHAYSIVVLDQNKQRWDNASPRSQKFAENIKKSVPPKVLAQFERCRAAHANLLENSAISYAAVLAGNWAGLDAGYMNTMTGWYLATKVAYLVCYISIERQRYAWIRSTAFGTGFLILLHIFYKAASATYAKTAL